MIITEKVLMLQVSRKTELVLSSSTVKKEHTKEE